MNRRSVRGISGSRKSLARLTSVSGQKVQADNKFPDSLERESKVDFLGNRKSLNRLSRVSGRKLPIADNDLSPEGENKKRQSSTENSDSRKKSLLATNNSKELGKRRLSFASVTKQYHSTLEFEKSDVTLVEERLSLEKSESSDEIEGTEKLLEFHEKIIDSQGHIELITREVKTFEKNKEDIQKQSEPSVEDVDEYEEIEEEVDEEIEVEVEEEEEEEVEEEEEEDEEGHEKESEEYVYGERVDEHILEDEEIDEAMTEELEGREVEEIEEQDLSTWDKSEKEESEEEEIIQDECTESSADLEVADKEDNVPQEENEEPKEGEDRKEGEVGVFEKRSVEIKKEVAHEHELAEEIDSKRSSDEIKFERKKSPVKRKYITKTIKVIKIVRKKKEKENVVFPKEDIAIQQQTKLEEKKKVVPVEQDDKLIEMVKNKILELNRAKTKNKMLQKSIIDLCKQKRIDYVSEVASVSSESLRKYHKILKQLEKIMNTTSVEKNRITTEINMMKEILAKYEKQYSKELTELFRWERELGRSVTDSLSRKPVDEKILDNLIQRHEAVLKQLSEIRLKMIKVYNNFTSRKKAFEELICVGENLSLIDYEQLRLENQMFAEKIEERDEELSCLRKRMIAIFHTYAHVLEKSNLILDDIEISESKLNSVNLGMNYFREQASGLKQFRDGLRIETSQMKKSAGLLIRPSLAMDFENSLRKIKEGKIRLQEIIKLFNVQRSEIVKLRKADSDSNFLL